MSINLSNKAYPSDYMIQHKQSPMARHVARQPASPCAPNAPRMHAKDYMSNTVGWSAETIGSARE